MHRIDTPTAQADKFGPGKNGFTNGDKATGRRATDLDSDMWDAVQEELCNVIEKSGLSLNKGQHDQLYQALVGMITSKIPDALIRSKNLSDVVDKVVALANLNGVPKTTTVNGHALSGNTNITAQDIFNGQAVSIGNAVDLNTLQTPGLYYQAANAQAASGKNYPEAVAGSLEVYKHAGITQIYRVYNSSRSYIRSLYSSAWSAWTKQYDTANKPTPAEIGALASNGNAVSATKLQTARTIAGVSFDGTANIAIPAGNVGAYTKAESDGRFQPKGSYTPTGTAYTKAESDARYNLKNTATKATNAMTSKDASTGVMEVVMSNITVAANTNVSVTFSTAFPSVCVGVVIAYDGTGHGNDSDSTIAVSSYSRTGCVLHAYNAQGKFMLIAKGY